MPWHIAAGEQFDVHITVGDYDVACAVVERVPSGFIFIGSSLDPCQVVCPGKYCARFWRTDIPSGEGSLVFILMGEHEFTYTLMAAPFAMPWQYSIKGKAIDFNLQPHLIRGDYWIRVDASL